MDSTKKNIGKTVTFEIHSNGEVLSGELRVEKITVCHEVNRIGTAEIRLLCGDMPNSDVPESASSDFVPGAEIKIYLGYESKIKEVFSGIVTSHRIRMPQRLQQPMLLIVECKSHAVKTTFVRHNRVFQKKKDSEVISDVLGRSGLSVSVDETNVKHDQMVQYYCTDWDFALSRADASGLLVSTSGKKVNVFKPDFSVPEVTTVKYGYDLLSFDAKLLAESQSSMAECVGWSSSKQELVVSEVKAQATNAQGNVSVSDLSKSLGVDKICLQNEACYDPNILKEWGASQLFKFELSRYQGSFSFYGSEKVMPGCLIRLEGMGDRFNGKVFVGRVTHTYKPGSWITEVGMGISPANITQRTDVVAPPASGLLPGIEGLHVGTVHRLDEDPLSGFRIMVKVPILNGKENMVWARLSQFYASKGAGCHFVPSVGDEVILGFINNDPNMAVVLGSLYSAKYPAIYDYDAENKKRAIVSPEKLTILLDDGSKMIRFQTPDGNSIEICDKDKHVLISDRNGNKVELSKDGISLKTSKIISMEANEIKLNAQKNISVSTKAGAVKVEGKDVDVKAKMNAKFSSSLSTEISSSLNMTVKGILVKIN
ncbi:MAG: type VI secretion system tip protein VgrG [Paludibacteraceae bacterium]